MLDWSLRRGSSELIMVRWAGRVWSGLPTPDWLWLLVRWPSLPCMGEPLTRLAC